MRCYSPKFRNGHNSKSIKLFFCKTVTLFFPVILCNLLVLLYPAFGNSIYFNGVAKRLIQDGFDKKFIESIYRKEEVSFDITTTAFYMGYKDSKQNYKIFTSKKSIERALDYIARHKSELLSAEKIYGVDKNVITAIILVETYLGENLGSRYVLNTLSSLAAMDDSNIRKLVWERKRKSMKLSRDQFDERAIGKSHWSYKELKSFLKYTKDSNINPSVILGSFAGAMGISQFIPSNINFLGKDGNKDGVIDLFDHADAIASIANYLKYYGWSPGISKSDARKVIMHYNRSGYYADTIIEISNLLKG